MASSRAFSWSFLILARTRTSLPAEPESLLSGPVRVLVSTAEEWKKTPLSSLDESGRKKMAPKQRVIKALNTSNKMNFSVSLKEVGLADFLLGVAVKGRRVATGIFPPCSPSGNSNNTGKKNTHTRGAGSKNGGVESRRGSGSLASAHRSMSGRRARVRCQARGDSGESSGGKLRSERVSIPEPECAQSGAAGTGSGAGWGATDSRGERITFGHVSGGDPRGRGPAAPQYKSSDSSTKSTSLPGDMRSHMWDKKRKRKRKKKKRKRKRKKRNRKKKKRKRKRKRKRKKNGS